MKNPVYVIVTTACKQCRNPTNVVGIYTDPIKANSITKKDNESPWGCEHNKTKIYPIDEYNKEIRATAI